MLDSPWQPLSRLLLVMSSVLIPISYHHSDAAVNISRHLSYTLLQQFLWNVCVEVSNMHALHRLDSWLQNGRTNLPASRWHRTIHSPHISDSIGIMKFSNFCQSTKHKRMSQFF